VCKLVQRNEGLVANGADTDRRESDDVDRAIAPAAFAAEKGLGGETASLACGSRSWKPVKPKRSPKLLQPIVEGIRRHVFAAEKIQGDHTPVPVLEPGLGRTRTGAN
jgi:hypothetical protein